MEIEYLLTGQTCDKQGDICSIPSLMWVGSSDNGFVLVTVVIRNVIEVSLMASLRYCYKG